MTDWLYDNLDNIVIGAVILFIIAGFALYQNKISNWEDSCHNRGGRVTSTGGGHNLCLSPDGKILDSR